MLKKTFVVSDPVYRASISVVIGDFDYFKKVCESNDIEAAEQYRFRSGVCQEIQKDSGLGYVLWVRDKNDLKTITHELIHLVNFVFHTANIKTTFRNDEPMAYYYSYLFGEIYKQC